MFADIFRLFQKKRKNMEFSKIFQSVTNTVKVKTQKHTKQND